jgi:hypothetical protein
VPGGFQWYEKRQLVFYGYVMIYSMFDGYLMCTMYNSLVEYMQAESSLWKIVASKDIVRFSCSADHKYRPSSQSITR